MPSADNGLLPAYSPNHVLIQFLPGEPASHLNSKDGFERPVDVKVGPDGLVYVLDFGAFESTGASAKVFPKTGKVFRIEPAR